MRSVRGVALALALAACGSPIETDVDAGIDDRVATGTRLVDHPAIVGGLTTDGYVVFSDLDAASHTVAKAIPITGGDAITIATSTGTGKPDIRFEIRGPVVFAWTDRGNRVATLTIWSSATGPIPLGPGIRPGRAAATPDGAFVEYERAVTATTAEVVVGPIAGTPVLVGTANSADSDCWRDTDFATAGTGGSQRLLTRYCPDPSTAFALRSFTPDGASSIELSPAAADATYRPGHVVWHDTDGRLQVAGPDGSSPRTLAIDAIAYVVSADETRIAWLTTAGAIYTSALDGVPAPELMVAAPTAKLLGAMSPDNQTVLFASQIDDRGAGYVAPYTDVIAATRGRAPVTLVPTPTSCPGCLFSSFTPDSQYALVLDPIDNTTEADAEGPIHAFSLADGASVSTFGEAVYSAHALASGSGATSRFVVLAAVRDSMLATGWRYELTVRGLEPSDVPTLLARGAEDFTFDTAHTTAIVSFAGADPISGIWVAPLQ